MADTVNSTRWMRDLARPYLRGYRPRAQSRGTLRGYWFVSRLADRAARTAARSKQSEAGFFVGYLLHDEDFTYLMPIVPECLVFAFVRPVDGPAHHRLVRRPASLVRKTFDYIRWLTHRPPRFEFHERQRAAMVRHTSMRDWPRAKWRHFSGNFFIETLAWLVRSGLVRKLSS